MTKRILSSLFILFVFIFTACNNSLSKENDFLIGTNSSKTILQIKVLDDSRTIMPQISPDDFDKFTLRGISAGQNYNFGFWNSFDQLKKAKIEIDTGLWTFMLIATKGESTFLGVLRNINISAEDSKKELSFTLSHCTINFNDLSYELDVPLEMNEGKGGIEINFNYERLNYVKAAAVSLCTTDGQIISDYKDINLDLYPSDNKEKAVFKINGIPSGIYLADFSFYYDERKTCVVQNFLEYVYIAKDCVSRKNLFIDGFYNVFNVSYELNGFEWKEGYEPPLFISKKSVKTLPAADKINIGNNEFLGWYEDNSFTKPAGESLYADKRFYGKFKIKYNVDVYVQNLEDEDFVYNKTISAAGIVGHKSSLTDIAETELQIEKGNEYTLEEVILSPKTDSIKLYVKAKPVVVQIDITTITEDDIYETHEEIELPYGVNLSQEYIESLNLFDNKYVILYYQSGDSFDEPWKKFVWFITGRPILAELCQAIDKTEGSLYRYKADGLIPYKEFINLIQYIYSGSMAFCLDLTEISGAEYIDTESFLDNPVSELVLPKNFKKGVLGTCKITIPTVIIPSELTYIERGSFIGDICGGEVIFKDPENWMVKDSSGSQEVTIQLDSKELSDSKIAYRYLCSTYANYEWINTKE